MRKLLHGKEEEMGGKSKQIDHGNFKRESCMQQRRSKMNLEKKNSIKCDSAKINPTFPQYFVHNLSNRNSHGFIQTSSKAEQNLVWNIH